VNIGYWLTRLSGARQDVLDATPGDGPKQASLGAVLVGTAVMAAVSATFALSTAVHLPIPVAAVVGVLWGALILNLDRMLVVSMGRRTGLPANLATAVPRVVLALLIGTVISLPLVLRIFEPEINAELQVMRNDALGAAQTRIDQNPRFAEIPALEAEEKRLQGIVSGSAPPDVGDDPQVRRLREELAAKEQEFAKAEQDIICENDGTCGSGVAGRGPSYREKADRKSRLEAERNDLRNQLGDAESAARERFEDGAKSAAESMGPELERVQQELAARRAERAYESDNVRRAEIQNDGLLARLEALHRLSAGRPMMWMAHGALILLFVAIELLPVLVKLMAVTGPKSPYERIVEERDEKAVREQREIAEMRLAVRTELEEHRARAQVRAGKEANDVLVAVHKQIADKAVQVWAEVATRRADDELAAWLERHNRTGPYHSASNGAPAQCHCSTDTQPIPRYVHHQQKD
jgi:uncharacterized protein DUF4407